MTDDTTPEIECSDNALCGCPHCLEDDKILAEMAAEAASNRCDRCEQPHGLCRHTAAPIEVGDTISEHMAFGRWVRANELRPNSRVRDAEVAHMLAELIGVSSAYDSGYDAWLAVVNDYDHLDVTIDFLETADRSPSREVYRLTLERVK